MAVKKLMYKKIYTFMEKIGHKVWLMAFLCLYWKVYVPRLKECPTLRSMFSYWVWNKQNSKSLAPFIGKTHQKWDLCISQLNNGTNGGICVCFLLHIFLLAKVMSLNKCWLLVNYFLIKNVKIILHIDSIL